MTVKRVFKYFAIAFLFNGNICESILKGHKKRNAQLTLLDLLNRNDLDIRRIDSNEAEDLVKSIVKKNRNSNGKQRVIPLESILPPDYELTSDKFNKDSVTENTLKDILLSIKNKIDDLSPSDYESPLARAIHKIIQLNNPMLQDLFEENLLLNKEKNNNMIPLGYELLGNIDMPSNYELLGNKKIKGIIPFDYKLLSDKILPSDYELLRDKIIKRYVPPTHEIVRNRDLPPDYELGRDGKIKDLIPPDYELVSNRRLIPPDYDLVSNRRFIPPDYELVRNSYLSPDYSFLRSGKINHLISPNYELVRNRDIPTDYKVVRDIKAKSIITPDYELDRDIPPDFELLTNVIKHLKAPDYKLVKKSITPSDNVLERDRKRKTFRPPPDHELLRDETFQNLKYQYTVCKLAKKLKRLQFSEDGFIDITNDDTSRICLEESLGRAVRELLRIQVERLIPRDYETPLTEYNSKYNAYFKPLTRLFKGRPDDANSDDDELSFARNPSDDEDILEAFGLFGKQFKHSKRHRPLSYKEKTIASNLVKHIQYLVTQIKSPALKRLSFDSILDVLNNVENLRLGTTQLAQNEDTPPLNNPPPLSAYVPFFNYWTYQKTIVEDDCPGDSVKIGNVCSRTPLHRSGKRKE